LKLMEINPKFWASVDVALRAGVNFPYLLCESAKGESLSYSEEYNRSIKFHFPLSRELNHFLERPKAFPRILADCINPRVKSNIWINDLMPNVIEFASNISAIILSRMPKRIRRRIIEIATRQ
jgi:hypothetical protein